MCGHEADRSAWAETRRVRRGVVGALRRAQSRADSLRTYRWVWEQDARPHLGAVRLRDVTPLAEATRIKRARRGHRRAGAGRGDALRCSPAAASATRSLVVLLAYPDCARARHSRSNGGTSATTGCHWRRRWFPAAAASAAFGCARHTTSATRSPHSCSPRAGCRSSRSLPSCATPGLPRQLWARHGGAARRRQSLGGIAHRRCASGAACREPQIARGEFSA
jgi:hypothetical protein